MGLDVGKAEAGDSFEAGKKAVEEAGGENADLVYVFSSTDHDMEEVVAGAGDAAGDTPVIGASSTVEIAEGAETGSVVAAGFHGVDASIGIGKGLSDHSYNAGREAIKEAFQGLEKDISPYVLRQDGTHERDVLVNIFADALHGHGVHVLDGITDYLGHGFSTAGQFAGDDLSFEHTYVFYDGEVMEDAVVCSVVDWDGKVGGDKAHGFRKTPSTYEITDADATYLRELDGERPLTVYSEIYGEENAQDPGFLLMTPMGIDLGEEEPQLRVALDIDEDGCFSLGAPVKENVEVHLMRAEKPRLLDAAGRAAREARENAGLEKEEVDAALVFSCAGRHAVYDDMELTREEVERIKEEVGEDTPVVGLFAYGQIATSNGRPRFHEETASIQVLGQ